MPGGDRNAREFQAARSRQRGDLHVEQIIGGSVVYVGQAEVGDGERIRRIFKRGDCLAGTRRRIVDRRHVDRQRARRDIEIDSAIRGAAIVLHLEGKRRVARAAAIGRGREFEIARRDVRRRDQLARRDRHARELQAAGSGQGGDLHVEQGIRGTIVRIGIAEVAGGEGIGCVLQHGHRLVGADRRVVDRSYVHRHRPRSRIEIDAAVGGAAVVLHLESERRVARAVGVRRRRELEIARRDVRRRNKLPGGDRNPGQSKRTRARQRGDFDVEQRVRRSVGGIGETEIGNGKRVSGIFERGDRLVGARRRIVHRGHVDRHRARRGVEIHAAVRGAAVVLYLERETGVARAAGIRRRRELEVAGRDVRRRDKLIADHRHARQFQAACRRQGSNLDVEQIVRGAIDGIREAEVGNTERERGVFERSHRIVRAHRRVVDRGHVNRQRARRRIEIDAAIGGAAVVLHLKGETRIARTAAIGRRREFEVARRNVRRCDELAGGHCHAREFQTARYRQRRDLDVGERVGGTVGSIGESEVAGGEGVRRVFKHGHRLVGARRRVIDRRHVDRHRPRSGVEINAAVGGAAVVLHLEGKARVARAVGIRRRREREIARRDVCRRNKLPGGNGHTGKFHAARRRQRGDLHVEQRIGRAVVRIGQSKVGDGKRVRGIFEHRYRIARAHRRIVDRGHVDCQRVWRQVEIRAATKYAAVVLHLEGETRVARASAVRDRRELEIARGNVRCRDELSRGHRHA